MPKVKLKLTRREHIKDSLRTQGIDELRNRLFAWEALYNYTFLGDDAGMRGVYCAWCMRMILTMPSRAMLTKTIFDKLLAHPCFNPAYNIPETEL